MAACHICRKRPRTKACGKVIFVSGSCPICFTDCDTLVSLPCGHVACKECITDSGFRLAPEPRKRIPRPKPDPDAIPAPAPGWQAPASGAGRFQPAGLQPFDTVRIQGLVHRPNLNGQIGTLVGMLARSRWQVRLDSSGEMVSIQPDNLRWVERTSRRADAPAGADAAEWQPRPGGSAVLHGVLQRPHLNGHVVNLLAALPTGRWQVRVPSTGEEVAVRVDHLRPAPAA